MTPFDKHLTLKIQTKKRTGQRTPGTSSQIVSLLEHYSN